MSQSVPRSLPPLLTQLFGAVAVESRLPVVVATPKPLGDTGRDAVRVKESYQTWLVCETPEAADRYQQDDCAPAWAVLKAKTSLPRKNLWQGTGEENLVELWIQLEQCDFCPKC